MIIHQLISQRSRGILNYNPITRNYIIRKITKIAIRTTYINAQKFRTV